MKAAVLEQPNGKMKIEMLEIPKPKAGEVLVKTHGCGVCHTDLHVMKGHQPFPMPCVLGHEVTGEIIEHGSKNDFGTLERLPLGSKAVGAFIMPCGGCHFCNQGKEDICAQFFAMNRGRGGLYDGKTRLFRSITKSPVSMYSMGGLAEYCVVPATAVTVLPPSLPVVESAILGCAMFTAFGALRNAADLRAGQSVAVLGVGGVGFSCIQVAKAFGASKIIAVDIDKGKLEAVKKIGATHVVHSNPVTAADEIKSISDGLGVDVVIEAIGNPITFELALSFVRDGGKAIMVGIAPLGSTGKVDITRVVRRNISIIGSYGAKARKDLPTLVSMAEMGLLDVTSVVSEIHPLESAGQVYQRLDEGKILGRAVIDMSL